MNLRIMNNSSYESNKLVFERAVKKLQNSLQYLVDNDKISIKSIAIQNSIIRSLIEFYNFSESYISQLEIELFQIEFEKGKEIEQHLNTIVCLESTCLLHGIYDYPMWVYQGSKFLLEEVKRLHEANTVFVPSKLVELLKSLNQEQKQAINNILNAGYDEELKRLQNELAELKKKINGSKT